MKIQCPQCYHEFSPKKRKPFVKKAGRLDDPQLVRKTRVQIKEGVQAQI